MGRPVWGSRPLTESFELSFSAFNYHSRHIAVAIMDATSKFSALTTDDGLHETLMSAEEQDLYAQFAAADLGFRPITLPHSDGELFEDSTSSDLSEDSEDHWLGVDLFGFPPASESPDDEFSDSSNNDGLGFDESVLSAPVFLTLLSDKEIDTLFEEFGAAGANSLHIHASSHSNGRVSDSSVPNTPPASSTSDEDSDMLNESFSTNEATWLNINNSGDSGSEISDSRAYNNQKFDDRIFSVSISTPPASPTSDEESNMINGSFGTNAVKPHHVDGASAANTEINNHQHFSKQTPELLRCRPTPAIGIPRKTRTRARRQRYSPRIPSGFRTTQWKDVWIRVDNASIECGSGEVSEYRVTRDGWRKSSKAKVIESTSTEDYVYSWLEDSDDIAVWNPELIKYLEVRPANGFLVRISHDQDKGMFSGFDSVCKKYLRVSYSQVKVLLERPQESVYLGRM